MKAKREVKRMCVGCGEMFDKRELIRVVKSPEGEVSLDFNGQEKRPRRICVQQSRMPKKGKKKKIDRARLLNENRRRGL